MALTRLWHKLEPGKQLNKWRCLCNYALKQEQRSVWRFLFSEGVKPYRDTFSDENSVQWQVYVLYTNVWMEWEVKELRPLVWRFLLSRVKQSRKTLQRWRTWYGKSGATQSRKWHHYWTLVLDQSIASSHDELKFQKVCARCEATYCYSKCRLLSSCGFGASHIFTSSIHWRTRQVERGSGTTTRFGRTHWIENLSKACIGVGIKFSKKLCFITNGTQARALTKIRINMHISKNVKRNY